MSASRHHERTIESRPPDKFRLKDYVSLHDQTSEVTAASQYDSSALRLDKQSSASQATDKSPSRSDQRFNHTLQTKVGQKSSSTEYIDRENNLSLEKPIPDYCSQSKVGNREPTLVCPSSTNGIGKLCNRSPNHLQHPSKLRNDEPPPFGFYDDYDRFHIRDRKNYCHPKRSDLGPGRGHGNAWNNAPAWLPSVANGFLPLKHGLPFQQSPGPPLYGVGPPMQFSGAGIPHHMHNPINRFSGHVWAYGWPNQADESCLPHWRVWDGSSGIYGGNRGWEMSACTWNVQDNMNNIEFPVPPKELELEKHAIGQPGCQFQLEQHGLECLLANDVEANNDTSPVKFIPSKVKHDKKGIESLKVSSGGGTSFCRNYLSRINISPDLVGSELYGRCAALLEALNKNGARGVLSDGCPQLDVKEECGAITHGTGNTLLHSLFSSNGHSVFQRALSLYKKQTAAPLHSEGKNNLSEVHSELNEAAVLASHIIMSPPSSHPNTSMQEETPSKIMGPSIVGLENAPSDSVPACALEGSRHPVDMEEEQKTATDVAGDNPVDAEEQQSILGGDGGGFNNSCQGREDVMTEAVNLSRILNSPESTH